MTGTTSAPNANGLLARVRARRGPALSRPGWNLGLVVLILAVGTWASIRSPAFLDTFQLLSAAQASAVSAFLALGLALVVVVGEIDISLTSNLAFTTVVIGLLGQDGHGTAVIVVAALLSGGLLGALNGVLVAALGMPSLAVTLGTMGAYQGAAYLLGGNTAFVEFPPAIYGLASPLFGPVSASLVIFAALAVVLAVLMGATTIGRAMYAVGRTQEVVRRNGMSVAAVKVTAFTIGGLAAGLGAMVFVSYYGSGGGSSASGTILFVVTAVALGGFDIYGGSGRISGVVLALVLLTALRSGMGLLNVTTTVQTIVIGALLIASLTIANLAGDGGLLRRLRRRAPGAGRPAPS